MICGIHLLQGNDPSVEPILEAEIAITFSMVIMPEAAYWSQGIISLCPNTEN